MSERSYIVEMGKKTEDRKLYANARLKSRGVHIGGEESNNIRANRQSERYGEREAGGGCVRKTDLMEEHEHRVQPCTRIF